MKGKLILQELVMHQILLQNQAVELRKGRLPTREINTSFGEVNNVRVELLRDFGSSVSVVRSALVAPELYTVSRLPVC